MNSFRKIIALFTLLIFCPAFCFAARSYIDASTEWIDTPWKIRYILFLNSKKDMSTYIKSSQKENIKAIQGEKAYVYLDAMELLRHIQIDIHTKSEPIATAAVYFNKNGNVLNLQLPFTAFEAKLSQIDRLVLVSKNLSEKPYRIATWDQGIPGDVSFSPAVCSGTDVQRYGSYWRKTDSSGNVGCREWTAQLYRKEPYIDVTTYSKKGNFIGEVVGWARFEDGPKPIIGMQGRQWLCLHECPASEQPGVIPDMQAWTRKHGFPMPVPPPKQPLYPNEDYKDDLNEFWSH